MTTRGLFCISGVGTYAEAKDLAGVAAEISTMRRALEALGLIELCPFTTAERGHDDLRGALRKWAKSTDPADRSAEEALLIYCTGHGVVEDSRFRLQLSNGDLFEPGSLLTVLHHRKTLKQVALILDACFAEVGLDASLLEMRRPNTQTSKMEFWGIGSCRRLEPAAQQTFAIAFANVLDRRSRPSWLVSHFEPGAIAGDVNTAVGPEQTVWLAEGHAAIGCRVLPNPRHQSPAPPTRLPLPVDWAAEARGVSNANQPGFFFTGREDELVALRGHIDGKGAESTLIVTGAAGSGKSALLGHLVLIATGQDALPTDVRLRWPALPIRVIACRGDLNAVVRELSGGLGLPGRGFDDLVLALREAIGRTAVVLDQLNEVDSREEGWDVLLATLAEAPDIRLVLSLPVTPGIRLRIPHRTIDLDTLGDRTDEDVRDYLALRLALTHPNATRPDLQRLVSKVGRRKLGFKVAVAVANAYVDAVAQGHPATEAESRAERKATEVARQICRAILTSQLHERAGLVVDALWALCSYDESVAVPAREWAGAASAPSAAPVSPEEVTAAAARLGSFLECVPTAGGLDRWRPWLCSGTSVDAAPRERFLARLPQLTGLSEVDWDAVDPAVRTLVAFAASLHTEHGRLLDDPEFLLGAPPGLVSDAVRRLQNDPADRTRRSRVMRAVPRDGTPADRALVLGIAARRYGLKPVATAPTTARYRPAYDIKWVQPDRPREARLTRLSTTWAGTEPLAVTVDDRDALAFWSLADGSPTRSAVQVPGMPRTVTVANVAGHGLALVTNWQGEIWSVPCRGEGQPERRPEFVPPAVGGTRPHDLLVALHPGGQVVVGLGTDVWVGDVTAGHRMRHAATLESDPHTITTAGPVESPVAWVVTNAGRIRRLRLGDAAGFDVRLFPAPRRPLVVAVSPDGARALVVDVGGGLHLRGVGGEGDLLGGTRPPDIQAASVDDGFAVVAGGRAGDPGWLEAHDLTGSAPPSRVPLDEAPIGVALLGAGQVVVARPSGLLTLLPHASDVQPRIGGPLTSRTPAIRR